MATSIIDALIVTLGLDPSGFKRGKAEADAGLKDTKNIATGAADDIVGGIGKIALKFTALFTAVRGVTDIIDFFKELNHEIADLGYTSRQLGESAGNLRLYQQVAEGFGGTAKGVTGTVSSLETAMFNMRQMGQMSDQLVAFQRFGGGLPATNAQGGIDYPRMIAQLRGALSGLPAQEANQRMLAMGLDEGTRNAVLASTQDLAKWTEAQKKSATQTGAHTKAAQDLERSWLQLKNDAVGLSATVLGKTTPALEAMFAAIDKWVGSEGFTAVLKGIGDQLTRIGTAMNDITNGNFVKGFKDLLTGPELLKNPGSDAGKWIHDHVAKALGLDAVSLEKNRRAEAAPAFARLEQKYKLPTGALNRIATVESHYDASTPSKAGALGMFGLMPAFHPNAGANNSADAIDAAQTLASYHRLFGGDKGDPDWSKAYEAYNVGPGALKIALSGNGGTKGAETAAAAGRYIKKIQEVGATPPTSSTRGPTSLSIGHITLNLPNAKDADDISNDLADAIQRRFNVFQTDAGMV